MGTKKSITQRYQILRPLGEGGMGEVFLVEDRWEGNRQMALKRVRRELLSDITREGLAYEFIALKQLRHPNLATVYDFGFTPEGDPFFTSEYFIGKNLVAATGEASFGEKVTFVVELCRALSYIHARGYVHADLKPENILVVSGGKGGESRVKLLDFGLSRHLLDPARNRLSGTLAYLPPEALKGRPLDPRADLYSLGVVMYQVFARQLPFGSTESPLLVDMQLSVTPSSPSEKENSVPLELDAIILRLLEKDPQTRFQTADEVISAFNVSLGFQFEIDTQATAREYVRSGRFVGRTEELGRLKSALADIQDSGGGRLILVGGESGVGKTRLLEELKILAQLEGVRTFSGSAYERIPQPLQCFLDILRPMALSATGSSKGGSLLERYEASLSQILPEMFASRPPVIERNSPSGNEKELLLESLASFIMEVSAEQPTLILIQDLHWADALSIELLEKTARNLHDQRVIIGANYRVEEIKGTALEIAIPRLTRLEKVDSTILKPLDRNEAEDLVCSMLGVDHTPPPIVQRMYSETRGNPFFIQEVLWLWINEKIVSPRIGDWNIDPKSLDSAHVPSTMHDAFLRRISHLSKAQHDLLRVMTFFIEPVPAGAVSFVLDRDPDSTEKELDGLVESAVLARVETHDSPRYYLKHVQMKHSIESEVFPSSSQSIHGRIAQYYERAAPTILTEPSEALAYHYGESGDHQKARRYSIRAGDKLRALFSYANAITAYRRAEELSGDKDGLLPELREKIAFCHYQQGELREAEEIYRSLVKDKREHLTSGRLAKLHLRLGMIAEFRGDYNEAIEIMNRGLDLILSLPEAKTKADLLARIGFEYQRLSDYRVALDYVCRALLTVENVDNYFGLGDIYNIQFIIYYYLGDYNKALEAGHRAIAVYTKFGWLKGIAGVTANLGAIYEDYLHDYKKAINYQIRALHLRQKIFDRRGIEQSYLNLSSIHCKLGEFTTSLDYLDRAEQLNKSLPEKHVEVQIAHNRGENWTHLGEFEKAQDSLSGAMSLAEESQNQQVKIAILNRMAEWQEKLGQLEDAHITESNAIEIAVKTESRLEELCARIGLARIEIVSKQWIDAEKSVAAAMTIAEQLNHRDWQLQALLLQAKVDLANNNIEKCGSVLARSRALADETQNPLLKAQFHLIQGEMALVRKDPYLHSGAEDLHQALRFAEATEEFDLIADTRYALGLWYSIHGEIQAAETHFQQAKFIITAVANKLSDDLKFKYLESHNRRRRFDLVPTTTNRVKDKVMTGETFASHLVHRQNYSVTLFQITKIINSIFNINELLQQVMDLVLEAIKVERGLILLVNEDSGALEVKVARNISKATLDDATAISKTVLEEVMHGGKPLISVNAMDDHRLRERRSIVDFGIGMVLCIPLTVKQKIIGAVYIDNPVATLPFNEEDVNFLMSFTNLFSVAIENARLYEKVHQENIYLRHEVRAKYAYEEIIGRSPKMMDLFRKLDSIVTSSANVLISGESGTGKELIARTIHYSGNRKDKRFVAIDCGAIPENLIESELFGYKRGAFTGAVFDKKGLFEEADGGTIFLDEITNTSRALQAKLLRVIQEREIRRVGDSVDRKVDVRIIAATNRDLRQMVQSGEFREDLFYRLNVLILNIPPLRERSEDIPLLATKILKRLGAQNPSMSKRFSRAVVHMLTQYSFPGNVRELENLVESAFYMARGDEIQVSDFPDEICHARGELVPGNAPQTMGDGTRSSSTSTLKAIQSLNSKTKNGDSEARAEQLFVRMKDKGASFWEVVKEPFMRREISKELVRGVIALGLKETRGRYKELMKVFHLQESDYTVFMNFLRKHECQVDYRPFRRTFPPLV